MSTPEINQEDVLKLAQYISLGERLLQFNILDYEKKVVDLQIDSLKQRFDERNALLSQQTNMSNTSSIVPDDDSLEDYRDFSCALHRNNLFRLYKWANSLFMKIPLQSIRVKAREIDSTLEGIITKLEIEKNAALARMFGNNPETKKSDKEMLRVTYELFDLLEEKYILNP